VAYRVSMKRPRQSKATFPRLRELREEKLGWDVTELLMKLGGKPSVASIYRLEAGQSVRVANARRVFDVINAALDGQLDPAKELKIQGRR
jgi:hypothetical protein